MRKRIKLATTTHGPLMFRLEWQSVFEYRKIIAILTLLNLSGLSIPLFYPLTLPRYPLFCSLFLNLEKWKKWRGQIIKLFYWSSNLT
jgi:hypothetical protein